MKWRAVAMIVYLTLLIGYTYTLRSSATTQPAPAALASIPHQIGKYTGHDQTLDERVSELLGADETLFREYLTADERPIWVFLGHFGEPRENSQIHSPKHCYPGSGWSIFDESRVDVRFGDGRIDANCLMITDGEYEQTVVYWFQTDDGFVTNEFSLKWVQMKNTLLRRSRRTTFVRFSTVVENGDRSEAQDVLQRFVESFGPYLRGALDTDEAGT